MFQEQTSAGGAALNDPVNQLALTGVCRAIVQSPDLSPYCVLTAEDTNHFQATGNVALRRKRARRQLTDWEGAKLGTMAISIQKRCLICLIGH